MLASRQRLALFGAAAIAAIVWLMAFVPVRPTLRLTFFDVGDGACALIRTPSGKAVVVDCGTSSWRSPGSVGSKLIAPYLQSQGLDGIDAAVITHPHADHVSGFPALLKREPAEVVLDNGLGHISAEFRPILQAMKRSHARYRRLRRGQSVHTGDGVVLTVVGPTETSHEDPNENSLVLRLTYKRVAVLFSGDATRDSEAEILTSKPNLRAQVLVVGHHGSRDSTSPAWLAAVRPRIAVISCASRSRYGFPSREITRRLAAFGARTYVTGRCGAVTITSDGSTINVSSFK